MRNVYLTLVALAACHQIFAQAPPGAANAAARTQIVGQITSLDASARRIDLKDDHGAMITVSVPENTSVLRVPPGETDLKKATQIAFTDIGSGDRVLAVGTKSEDGKQLQARTLVIMSKADIAQKQQREQQDWQMRGVAGTVSAMDAAGKTLTVKAGQKTLTVQTGDQTEYRRYAPDSVKFSDSLPSSFAEIKPGDQIRALGDKSADGLAVKAERIVSGSFRQIAATISAIRAEAGEIKVTDLASKKTVTILVNSSSVVKKLSPVLAARLSQRFQVTPANDAPAAGARGPDLGQLLDRLPAIAVAELKPGDAIMVSGSTGNDSGRLTAITLLAGVEPLLTASPNATRDIMAGWNFGGENAPE